MTRHVVDKVTPKMGAKSNYPIKISHIFTADFSTID